MHRHSVTQLYFHCDAKPSSYSLLTHIITGESWCLIIPVGCTQLFTVSSNVIIDTQSYPYFQLISICLDDNNIIDNKRLHAEDRHLIGYSNRPLEIMLQQCQSPSQECLHWTKLSHDFLQILVSMEGSRTYPTRQHHQNWWKCLPTTWWAHSSSQQTWSAIFDSRTKSCS